MGIAEYDKQVKILEQDILQLALTIQRCQKLLDEKANKLDKLISDNIPF